MALYSGLPGSRQTSPAYALDPAYSLVDETFPAADPRTLYLTRTRTHSLSDLLAASLRPRDLIASYYVVDFPVIATNTRFIQY